MPETLDACPDESAYTLVLLGGFRLRRGTEHVRLPPLLQRLIARVALSNEMPRCMIASDLWPESPERRTAAGLRTSLWQIGRRCPGVLWATRHDVGLAPGIPVDVLRNQEHALKVITEATHTPAGDLLIGSNVRQELLPGWYDEWVLAERERDRQLRLHALESAAEELLARGNAGAAMQAALGALLLEPLRETAHLAVVRIHLSEGNYCEAIRQYNRSAAIMKEAFGVPPSPDFTELVRMIMPGEENQGRPRRDPADCRD